MAWAPTGTAMLEPSAAPSYEPTSAPSIAPTLEPTLAPSLAPSSAPTLEPTLAPSIAPTLGPSGAPTLDPTAAPTLDPTAAPSLEPSSGPTLAPTAVPTTEPTLDPTTAPSLEPSSGPTLEPTAVPTTAPTLEPTSAPSIAPTLEPTLRPSAFPTLLPSSVPTLQPSPFPTLQPSTAPTALPTFGPSPAPNPAPTFEPTSSPAPTAGGFIRIGVSVSFGATRAPTDADSNALKNAIAKKLDVTNTAIIGFVLTYVEAARRLTGWSDGAEGRQQQQQQQQRRRRRLSSDYTWSTSFDVTTVDSDYTVPEYEEWVEDKLNSTSGTYNISGEPLPIATLTTTADTRSPSPAPTQPNFYVYKPIGNITFGCGLDINITWRATGEARYCPYVDISLYSTFTEFEAYIEQDLPAHGQASLENYVWSPGLSYCGESWMIRVACTETLKYLGFSGEFTMSGNPSPTGAPSLEPTSPPSSEPTLEPSALPTISPSALPSLGPSLQPTSVPSLAPSKAPTLLPTPLPTEPFVYVRTPEVGDEYLCDETISVFWDIGPQLSTTCDKASLYLSTDGGANYPTTYTVYEMDSTSYRPHHNYTYKVNSSSAASLTRPTCGNLNNVYKLELRCQSVVYPALSGEFSVLSAPTSTPTAVPTQLPTLRPSSFPTMAPYSLPTRNPSPVPTISDLPTLYPAPLPTENAPARITVTSPLSKGSYSCGDAVLVAWTTSGEALGSCGTVDLYVYNNASRGIAPVPVISDLLNAPTNSYAWTTTSAYCGGEWKLRVFCSIAYSSYTASFSVDSAPTSVPTPKPTTASPTRMPTSMPTSEPTPLPTEEEDDDWLAATDALSVAGIGGIYIGSVAAFLLLACCTWSLIRVRRFSKKHQEELKALRDRADRGSDHVDLEMVDRDVDDGNYDRSSTTETTSTRLSPNNSKSSAGKAANHFGNHIERLSAQMARKPNSQEKRNGKPPKPPKPSKFGGEYGGNSYNDDEYDDDDDEYTSSGSDGDATVSTDKDFSHWSREDDAQHDYDERGRTSRGQRQRYQNNPLRNVRR